jgi:hypothetical protein
MRSGMHALSTNSPYARHGTRARRTARRNMRGTRSCGRMRACVMHSGLCGLQVYQPAALAVGRGLADEDSAEGASAQRPGGNVKVFGPSRVYEFCERNGIEVIVTSVSRPSQPPWVAVG